MTRFKYVLDIAVTVLVVIAACLVIWRHFAPTRPPGVRPPVEDANGTIPAEIATHARGTGPVALVEFADFECPFCGQHARDVAPIVREAFIDTGIVRHIFVNYPLGNHQRAVPASEAALCAGKQDKFWEMHDALFRNQANLAQGDLTNRALELGLDIEQFSLCISGGRERQLIERQMSAARELSVRGTPAFFLGTVQKDGSVAVKKRINGAQPFSEFRSAIMDVAPRELRERISEVALNALASGERSKL